MLTVLLGGARSGKSALAVELARRAGESVTYLATSPRIEGDDDLDDRIAQHRLERPSAWTTIEEQLDLVDRAGDDHDAGRDRRLPHDVGRQRDPPRTTRTSTYTTSRGWRSTPSLGRA